MKELLDIAKEQLQGLSTLENPDIRLEEVEYKKEEGIWEIVISYLVEHTNKRVNKTVNVINPIFPVTTPEFQYHRLYKRLKINKNKEIEGLYMYDK